MKKYSYMIFLMLFCCYILFGNATFVTAAQETHPEVIYNGTLRAFSFRNVTNTDLFELYKDLVPGDVKEQPITLKTQLMRKETSIYLRAECTSEVQEALKDCVMDVYLEDELIVKNHLIFENTILGTFTKADEKEITVMLHIPTAYGNEISGKEFQIKWIFTAQEDGKDVVVDTPPKTGDSSLWEIYLIVSIVMLLIIAFAGRKIICNKEIN